MARNDETITLRIEGEDAGFIRVTEQVANQLRQMEGEAKDLQAELDKMERQDRLVSQFRELNRVTQSLEGNFDQTRAALIQTRREMGRGANATAEQAQNLARVEREHRNARTALRTHERALQNVRREAARYNTTLDVTDDQLANVRREQQRLNAELARSRGAYRDLATAQPRVNDGLREGGRSADAMTRAFKRLSQAYIAYTLAHHAASGVKDQIDEFGELEEALVGVQKTAEGMTKNELADMGDEIKRLATEITPTAATELAKFAQAAGQMGVQGQDALIAYVKLADQLAIATDLTGDAAVTALTRIVKLSTSTQDEISNLGASLVALGNTSSVTESELLHFANDVMTRIGSTANVSGDEVLGLAASLAELGIQPERASTSLQKLFAFIVDAVNNGGDAMKVFQDITGETAEVLRDEFAESGTKSFERLVKGFVTAQKSGQGFKVRLAQMGETGTIVNGVVNTLVGSFDRMSERIKFSGEEAAKNTAHINEAGKFYATQNAEIGRMRNNYKKLSASIGEAWGDETQEAIDAINQLLVDNKDQLVDVAEIAADFAEAWVIMLSRIANTGESLTGLVGETKVIQGIVFTFQTLMEAIGGAFNILQVIMNNVVLEFQKLANKLTFGSFQKDIEETQHRLNGLTQSFVDSGDRIKKSWRILGGATTTAFEDLKDGIEKYSKSINDLSVQDQVAIESVRRQKSGLAELNGEYRRLLNALLSAAKEKKVAIAQQKEANEVDEKATQITEEKRTEEGKSLIAQRHLATVGKEVEASESERLETSKNLLEQIKNSNVEIRKSTEEAAKLNKAHADGAITDYEYYIGLDKITKEIDEQTTLQGKLGAEVAKTGNTFSSSVKDVNEYTGAVNKAQIVVDKLVSEIDSQEKALKGMVKGTTVYNKQLALLNQTRSKAIDAQRELRNLQDLENKTVSELNISYRQLSKEMEILEERYRRNELTAGAYANQKAILAEKLAIVKGYLGDNAQLLDKTNKAYRNAASGIDAYNKALEKNTDILADNLEKHRKRIELLKQERDEQIKNQSLSFADSDYSGFDIDDIYEEEQRLQSLIRLNNKAGFVSRPVAELATTQLREQLDRLQKLREELKIESGKVDKRFPVKYYDEERDRFGKFKVGKDSEGGEHYYDEKMGRGKFYPDDEKKAIEQSNKAATSLNNAAVTLEKAAQQMSSASLPSIINIQLPTGITPIEVANDQSRDNLLNLLNIQNQGKQ
ncbi:MAG: hypothetical protein GY829_04470 [Gammaproteobacteria bacterium]|nr:hypothetical protein [Gammaproteobacteria bacterium]MCP4881120.1 hypothetical protein [Gammaproteobacteria bacterium]